MNRIATFEKVSPTQFVGDFVGEFKKPDNMDDIDWLAVVDSWYDSIQLPTRGTSQSAGYDIASTLPLIELKPGESVKIPTGLRCRIDDGWVMLIMPRSSVGFKYNVTLANTVGVIDADYYNAENQGHIWIKLKNLGDKVFSLNEGDRFAQAVFVPFGITTDDNINKERTGGMGSTGA